MQHRSVLSTPRHDLEIVITDDGSRTIRLKGKDITWHSESGALAESEIVFLQNSAVRDRLQKGQPTRVLEIGLGTGLNFWITASLACRSKTPLSYVGAEPNLMSQDLIELLEHGQLDSCQPGFDFFFRPIFEQQSFRVAIDRVVFERIENPRSIFANLREPFDAIYHDPFSPEVAPDLWNVDLFAELRSVLNPSGRLVTYCVKSTVQRALKAADFRIEKTRGPVGGKREVLIAFNESSPVS
jgi:tRNA U34 5-methylaminomethyl-2-thiouridine-forming methyltransferase MnmC